MGISGDVVGIRNATSSGTSRNKKWSNTGITYERITMKTDRKRQEFLLTFFIGDGYEEKEVNGWWLVKHWDGNTKDWTVFIYTPESYRKYKAVASLWREKSELREEYERKVIEE